MFRGFFAVLLGLLVFATPTVALAHHSAAGGMDCGTRDVDLVSFMTKGRTDGMVYTVDASVDKGNGCIAHVHLRNLVGTGVDEAYGYPGQKENCQRYAVEDASNIFRYYFDTDPPTEMTVSCSPYAGPD